MTNEELIARQAKELEELKDKLKSREKDLRSIKMELICIGGPLNDNVLLYSKEQLKPFFRIYDHCCYI